jgi:integrase
VTGKRQQKTYTYDTRTEARNERSRIVSERAQGTYVRPSKMTLNEHLDEWLPPVIRDLAESTKRNYTDALRPARERLGDKPLQKITKADVENLADWMLTSGRRMGGKRGTGLSGRTVNLTIDMLKAALEVAADEGKITRNPARLVKHVKHDPKQRGAWSKEELMKFLATAREERLHAAWRLSVYGLRRGEALGLRWDRVDLDAKTITVSESRVLVAGKVIAKPPKTKNGERTLPLDDVMVAALKALKVQQASEKLAAGPAYQDSGYLVVNELGEPLDPDWYSDEFKRLSERAGVPAVVLHGARHSCLTYLRMTGVPGPIVALWAGHADLTVADRNYVHPSMKDLEQGRDALAKLG